MDTLAGPPASSSNHTNTTNLPDDDSDTCAGRNQRQKQRITTIASAVTLNIVFFFLIFVPLGILGSALEWPQNLEEDASHNLPLLLEEQSSTFWGYFIYLLYSILFYPMAATMASTVALVVADTRTTTSTSQQQMPNIVLLLCNIGNGFAALSSVCRSIGLSRWLFAMPTLARIYVQEDTSEATKETISICYEMLNSWGGGIGEILGVSLFAALWVFCTSILYILSPLWPSWMGYFGFVVAIDLALNLLEMSILDTDMGINLTLAVVLLHLWILLGAIVFLRPACCSAAKCLPTAGADDTMIEAVVTKDDNNNQALPVAGNELGDDTAVSRSTRSMR